MKRQAMSFVFFVAVAVSIALIGGGTTAAQNNTGFREGALQSKNTIRIGIQRTRIATCIAKIVRCKRGSHSILGGANE